MVSHCQTQSKRETYVKQLQQHLTVDILGKCGTLRCPYDLERRPKNATISRREACYRLLAQTHFFYLSFENSLCEDYVTEKFWYALRAGIVPVVMGPEREAYERVAPPHSFIHVQDFPGPAELAAYLIFLTHDRTAYEQYLDWRSSYRVLMETLPGPRILETSTKQTLCVLCEYVNREREPKTVELSTFWSAKQHCRQPAWIK